VTRVLAGVFGPLVSTFDARGELDLDAFGSNIRAHLAAGLAGVVVTGSTGEAALLDESERSRLVEMARSVVPADKWVIVGTGAESTRACVRRNREAAERGADAVLVVAPHYYTSAMTPAALKAHYERIADESPIPVLLYNIPKYMHFRLEGDLVAQLAEHENIVGMKDSSGDMAYFPTYLASQGNGFTVLTGNGGSFQQALSLGACGGILAVALFAAELAVEVYALHQQGRAAEASDAQRRLTVLSNEIVGRMGVPAVKLALDRIGLRGGPVRLPLLAPSAADVGDVERLLRDASVDIAA
jgi:4-hydroxy-2-oxoglutarate aldolase